MLNRNTIWLFGAIHVRTGHRLLLPRRRQRAEDFQAFLQFVHEHYRGWPVWLLLDEDSSHTARASVGLARELQIGLIWLPKRCPELNAMDHLRGHAKGEVCANHQDPSIDHLVESFIRYIQSLSPVEARRKAGILSEDYWLVEDKTCYRRPLVAGRGKGERPLGNGHVRSVLFLAWPCMSTPILRKTRRSKASEVATVPIRAR